MTSIEIIILVFAGLMTVIGVALIAQTRTISKILTEIVGESEDMFGFGIWTLIAGLVVLGIAGYQITWTGTLWVVPLLGWMATIKGATLILMPGAFKSITKPLAKSSGLMVFVGLISLVIGIWLFYLL